MGTGKLLRIAILVTPILAAGCGDKSHSFSADVMPILAKNCLSCHKRGAEGYAASGFSVESYDSVMRGTKFGPVVSPGFSYASTLQILIEHKGDKSINMPKGRPPLTESEVQIIGEWIDEGAADN